MTCYLVGAWNFIGVAWQHTGTRYECDAHHLNLVTGSWQSISQNMPNGEVFTDTPSFFTYIGGLLSDAKANTYSQLFTGTMHSFTWGDGSYFLLNDF